ncbi:hypothetical protein AAC387_Pa05g3241 [Persea americana]
MFTLTASVISGWCIYYSTCSDQTLGRSLIALIALALNLDEDLFEKVGACRVFMRLLHYPVETSDIMNYGASAHSDYGMITILATDGVAFFVDPNLALLNAYKAAAVTPALQSFLPSAARTTWKSVLGLHMP